MLCVIASFIRCTYHNCVSDSVFRIVFLICKMLKVSYKMKVMKILNQFIGGILLFFIILQPSVVIAQKLPAQRIVQESKEDLIELLNEVIEDESEQEFVQKRKRLVQTLKALSPEALQTFFVEYNKKCLLDLEEYNAN